MRLLTLIAATFVGSQLLAFNPLASKGNATFSGEGDYKTTCGKSGKYTSTLTFADMEMTGKVTVDDKEFTYKLAAKKGENGFFAVTPGKDVDKVIGGGYCFEKLCHYGIMHEKGGGVEETFYMDDQHLHVIGSKWQVGKPKAGECSATAWKAKLVKE